MHYYRQTGQGEAMELLDLLAEYHPAHSTHVDGTINLELHPSHTHSCLNTMKGLLLFGLMTGQRRYVDAVDATYRVSIRTRVVKGSGFASHDSLQDCLGEVASTMDAAEVAMHLGLNGCPEYPARILALLESEAADLGEITALAAVHGLTADWGRFGGRFLDG